ncbi:uncharacterized protein LOC126746327 isoform X1 [Anthonomus grandis grandis]|uniref:uncharacterized protein LOC126746327 isoform X1 n=1 Tax=Anthonomus grandis grandis TaxID=2921223 RepID=UPI002165779C|nr:uncharacterized protein LOC126746327 isoform X1 [Anthonomus grandis grandis]XP_050310483.1 uncharacterized protein LOC126746327 isoform X1 [Anthonomus grandis grandis]
MGERIDPREVLAYLNELGYTNISAQQLKEFIKDLKKIIKYDYRTRQQPCSESVEYLSDNTELNYSSDKENLPCEPAPKAPKEKHIAVHIYDKKTRRCIDHEHCIHTCLTEPANKTQVTQTVDLSSKPESTVAPPPSVMTSRASSKDRKARVAFIKPKVLKPMVNKTDPVALYHYYQSQWKRAKIPGQESRDDLRWAIREKMLNGPKVEVKSRCSSGTPRSVCFR